MNALRYKGYETNIGYDEDAAVWFGKIEGISDLVTFESTSAAGAEDEFRAAVDDYIAFCEQVGKVADKRIKLNFAIA